MRKETTKQQLLKGITKKRAYWSWLNSSTERMKPYSPSRSRRRSSVIESGSPVMQSTDSSYKIFHEKSEDDMKNDPARTSPCQGRPESNRAGAQYRSSSDRARGIKTGTLNPIWGNQCIMGYSTNYRIMKLRCRMAWGNVHLIGVFRLWLEVARRIQSRLDTGFLCRWLLRSNFIRALFMKRYNYVLFFP